MQGVRVSIALLCCIVSCLADHQILQVWKGTENELYENVLWETNFGTLIIVKDDPEKQSEFEMMKNQLKDSGIFFLEVSCSDSVGGLCEMLAQHSFAVRPGEDELVPVDVPQEYKNMEIVYILQMLLKDRLTIFNSYNELKELFSENDQLFLALVTKSNSQEYLQLLRSWFMYDIPVAMTTNANSLPLAHRPAHSFNPKPIYMWCVLKQHNQWLKFSYSIVKDNDEEESLITFRDKLEGFVARLQLPLASEYNEELIKSVTGYHIVYAFPGLLKDSLNVRTLLRKVAAALFNDYLFFFGQRDTKYATRLFVTHEKSQPLIIVVPFGKEKELFILDIESNDLDQEALSAHRILDSFATQNPVIDNSDESTAPPLVTLIDPVFLSVIIQDKHTHVLVAFCIKGTDDCPGLPLEIMTQVMLAVQRNNHLPKLGNFGCYVIECDSMDDVSAFGFTVLPSYGMYNFTKDKWYRMDKELSKAFQAMAVLVLSSGLDELIGVDLSNSDSYEDGEHSSTQLDDESYTSPLSEDDHFAQVVATLATVNPPKEPALTNKNFEEIVSKYDTAVVVFFMPWDTRSQVFLNHIATAHDRMDKTKNVCLAAVSCSDWTDLCIRQGVITYPTALVFTPDTLTTPTHLTHLSTPYLLNALGQYPMDNKDQLSELSPETLPTLLKGDLAKTLVVWCDSEVKSEKAEVFKSLSATTDESRVFAWIDSSKYKSLLLVITKVDLHFPTVLVMKLSKHDVYQFAVSEGQTVTEFENGLVTFLTAIDNGEAAPVATLPVQSWSPIQPPVHFPSDEEGDYNEPQAPQQSEEAPVVKEQLTTTPLHSESHTEL